MGLQSELEFVSMLDDGSWIAFHVFGAANLGLCEDVEQKDGSEGKEDSIFFVFFFFFHFFFSFSLPPRFSFRVTYTR